MNDLYKELEHKADLYYELSAESVEEFLRDVVDILIKNSETRTDENVLSNCLENFTKKCYNMLANGCTEIYSDVVFDVINDIISTMDRGLYPFKVENSCIYFCKTKVTLRIKALTYHMFFVQRSGEKIYARMVFDI
ncbi:MAG: archease [Fervidobacterium sp.]|nr:archease [Fervidobacterium sp.]